METNIQMKIKCECGGSLIELAMIFPERKEFMCEKCKQRYIQEKIPFFKREMNNKEGL